MKINFLKILYFICGLSLMSLCAQAQTIPDPNFAKAIRKFCPGCIDTNNKLLPPAQTLTYLDVSSSNITDLTGIEGFASLQTLNCGSNNLMTLPTLPKSLTKLYCYYNKLTFLPSLPNSLILLYCYVNKLTSLPSLPNSLTDLSCNVNQLTSLPALPNSLTKLDCGANQTTTLPTLPNNLSALGCYSNQLTSLPTLPDGLKELDCENNQLTSLPTLPNSLTDLNCSFNQLTSLPTLPNSLTDLYCNVNHLTSLPTLSNSLTNLDCYENWLSSLPDLSNSLKSLDCSSNQLTSLPTLPNGLKELACDNNQLTALPTLPSGLTGLYIEKNPVLCLPTLPNTLQKLSLDKVKITCLPNNVNGLKVYNTKALQNIIPAPPICVAPTATLSGEQTIMTGQTANLSVKLTGIGPWEVVMNDKKYRVTASSFTIAVSPTATTTYTLSSVKTNCNVGSVNGQAVVTVIQCDIPTVGISTDDKFVVCAGSTLKLSSRVSGGVGDYTYQWVKNGVTFGTNTTDLEVSEAGQYVLAVIDSKGCVGVSSIVTISKGNPTVSITGKNAFCKGSSTTLTAAVQNAPGIVQYQWKQESKNVGDGKNKWAVSQVGSYTVEITDANGCKASAKAVSVTEKGSDIVSTVKPEGPINIYVPDTIVLSATTGYDKDPRYKFQWRKDDKDIVGASGYTYTVKNSGNYAVTVSDADCAITSTAVQVTVSMPLAIALNASEELRIYPNPTDGLLVVSGTLKQKKTLALKLLDMTGRTLQTLELPNQTNFEKLIDISDYSTGTYIFEVNGKDFSKQVKIFKN